MRCPFYTCVLPWCQTKSVAGGSYTRRIESKARCREFSDALRTLSWLRTWYNVVVRSVWSKVSGSYAAFVDCIEGRTRRIRAGEACDDMGQDAGVCSGMCGDANPIVFSTGAEEKSVSHKHEVSSGMVLESYKRTGRKPVNRTCGDGVDTASPLEVVLMDRKSGFRWLDYDGGYLTGFIDGVDLRMQRKLQSQDDYFIGYWHGAMVWKAVTKGMSA